MCKIRQLHVQFVDLHSVHCGLKWLSARDLQNKWFPPVCLVLERSAAYTCEVLNSIFTGILWKISLLLTKLEFISACIVLHLLATALLQTKVFADTLNALAALVALRLKLETTPFCPQSILSVLYNVWFWEQTDLSLCSIHSWSARWKHAFSFMRKEMVFCISLYNGD